MASEHDLPPPLPSDDELPEAPQPSVRRGPRARAFELNIGEVVSSSFKIWGRNLVPFSVLAIIVHSPVIILGAIWYSAAHTVEETSIFSSLVSFLQGLILNQLLSAVIIYGVFEQLRGRRPGVGKCISVGVTRLPLAIGVVLLSTLVILGGTLLLIIPGIILTFALYVALPVAVVERPGVVKSLRRSAELTKGSRWAIFAIALITSILLSLILLLVGGAITLILSLGGTPFTEETFNMIVLFGSIPFQAIGGVVPAVMYHDLRVGKEGVGIEDLAAVFE